MERRLDETLRRLEATLPLLPPELLAAHPWAAAAVGYLDRRARSGRSGACPLPELFAALVEQHPGLSIVGFHDGLRRFAYRGVLELHPVADLSGVARPKFALLDADRVLFLAVR